VFSNARCLAVYVTDLDRAIRFYTEVLGFEVRVRLNPDLCFLSSKEPGLDIYLEGGMEPSRTGERSSRLGFFLQTEGPAREAFDRLRAMGVKVIDEEPVEVDDETLTFRFEDPDGNLLDASGPA
jgi:catechol 2,3-dioxygenase-like lactoylglutathione lyase family enzyme